MLFALVGSLFLGLVLTLVMFNHIEKRLGHLTSAHNGLSARSSGLHERVAKLEVLHEGAHQPT